MKLDPVLDEIILLYSKSSADISSSPLPLADSLTNSIKMLTRSDIILEKRVAADEEAARTEAEATAREVARLARAAANTRAAFDGALQNITAGVRQVEGGQTSPESALMKSSNITLVHFSSIVYL